MYEGEDTFAVFLNNYNYKSIPVPSGFEDISVNETGYDEFGDAGTYMTYLWDDFNIIKETYTERIKNGEDIETLADEIMPESRKDKKLTDEIMPESKTDKKQNDKKRIVNVLRNICYDRAFNTKLSYDEAWKKVRDTYRKFVIKVLNAVKWLSENGYIEPTDDNNEEMENNEL